MKKIFTSTLVLVLTTLSTQVFAQFVNIPDGNFKTILVGNASINTSGDGEISFTEAAAYNGAIIAGTQSISDLTGIEAFTNLTVLDVSQNSLTWIDLSHNTALSSLNCSFNSLNCLDLSDNTSITSVDCSFNNLANLNLKNGNNAALTSMTSASNGMLYCIQVDNVANALSAGWSYDTWSTYNTLCGLPVIASIGSDAPVCFGSPITFSNATMYASTYIWNFGNGDTSTMMAPTYTYPLSGNYNVEMIARSCTDRDTGYLSIMQGTDLFGHVTYSGGDVINGTAVLFTDMPFFISFDTLQLSALDGSGYYHFTNIPQGNYLVQIYPDSATYPTLIPTYYTSYWVWDSANVVGHGCYLDDFADITMVELTPTVPDIGSAQGFVIEGPGFGRAQGDPVHGVVVKLGVTASTQIIATTTTNGAGQFTFGNLPFGNYTIYVDIAGLHRDSVYNIIIDATTNQFQNLYYVVDSNSIYIVPGIGIEDLGSVDHNKLNVFPNPVRENSTIEYTISTDANVQLEVYNVVGIKVQSLLTAHLQSGTYNANFNPKNMGLKSGIYFITLTAGGKRKTARIVVLE